MLVWRKIFSVVRFFTKLFAIAVVLFLYKYLIFLKSISSPHIVRCYRKHFYSILTNLSNLSPASSHSQLTSKFTQLAHQQVHQQVHTTCSRSKSSIVPFAKFRSDLKNVLTKHFPTMQSFANVLQNRSFLNFLIFARKYLCWSLLLIKLHT